VGGTYLPGTTTRRGSRSNCGHTWGPVATSRACRTPPPPVQTATGDLCPPGDAPSPCTCARVDRPYAIAEGDIKAAIDDYLAIRREEGVYRDLTCHDYEDAYRRERYLLKSAFEDQEPSRMRCRPLSTTSAWGATRRPTPKELRRRSSEAPFDEPSSTRRQYPRSTEPVGFPGTCGTPGTYRPRSCSRSPEASPERHVSQVPGRFRHRTCGPTARAEGRVSGVPGLMPKGD
jgi:hypothetical protein